MNRSLIKRRFPTDPMEKLSKFVISRLALRQQQPGADHPKTDTLAAFAEGRLSLRERTEVLGHLSRCPECREVVALSSAGDGNPIHLTPPDLRRGAGRWRWAAALAVACLVIAVIWSPQIIRERLRKPPVPAPPSPAIKTPTPAIPQQAKPERRTKQARPPQPRRAANAPVFKQKIDPEMAVIAPPSAPRLHSKTRENAQGFVGGVVSQFRSQKIAEGSAVSLWSLPSPGDARGTVQRSEDGGKTWAGVRVDGLSRLYALSATGTEVWAGGEEGALFHSLDNGAHWTPVIVSDGVSKLNDAITRIDVREDGFIQLQAQGGSRWVTTDNGLHSRME